MSSPTRKRRERGDENAEGSERATQPNPRRQRADGNGDNADLERSRSATSRLWSVLHDPSAKVYHDDTRFQPEAFLALIEDVFRNGRDAAEYRLRVAARSILSSQTFDKLFKQLFYGCLGHSSSSGEDELCLIERIRSLRLDMGRGEKGGRVGLCLIDRIISYILFRIWDGKDWSVDRLSLIERIVAVIVDEIDSEEGGQVDDLCLIKRMVSFIDEVIGDKDDQVDKLDQILRISYLILRPMDDEGHYLIPKAYVMGLIAYNLYEGAISKKDDLVDQLNLIDRIVSFFLNVNKAEKDGQVDKLFLIEQMASFIDDNIGEKDGQVDKPRQIKQILNFFVEDIYFLPMDDLVDKFRLMQQIATLLEMIKGEKDGQVDKLSLMEQIISFLEDDRRFDKLKLMQYIVSRSKRKLVGHGSSRSTTEAFDRESEAIHREIELLIEAPTQNTMRDTLKGYKGRSKYMQYFARQEGNKWSCNLCGKDDPLERKILERNKGGTTTPFLRHLEKFHMEEYNKIRDAEKQKNKRQNLDPIS